MPPPRSVEFFFVCQRRYEDLAETASPIERHCDTCRRDVIDLDALPPAARDRLLDLNEEAGLELCVATSNHLHAVNCVRPGEPMPPVRLAGAPMPPPSDAQRREMAAHAKRRALAVRETRQILDDARGRTRR